MAGKRRTPLPRSPARKRKPRTKPVSPRAKGESGAARGAASGGDAVSAGRRQLPLDRGAADRGTWSGVRRRTRDEPGTGDDEDRARLKENDLGRCDRGDGRASARAGAAARGPAGARECPGGSGVREGAVAVREGPRAGGPTGDRAEGTAVPVRCRIGAGTRPAASRGRGMRRTLRTRGRGRS